METISYKGYEGTIEVDIDRGVCRGKILFINDLVTYESQSINKLKVEFEAAIDDYLETCATLGREAQKPFRGQFNVRISPEMHKKLAVRAMHDNVSQNEIVARSLDVYLNGLPATNHTVNVTVAVKETDIKTLTSTPTRQLTWQETSYVH